VFATLLAAVVLHEEVSLTRIVGALVVVAGVAAIAYA
jgi:drug/metabolite transporter (DMT)-like permease